MKISDLKLTVASIPDAGLVLEGDLPVEWVAESLLDAYTPNSPVSLRIEVQVVNDNVVAQGRARVQLGYECSRTLTPSEMTLDVDFAELYLPGDERHTFKLGDGIEIDSVEDEPYTIIDGELDLEQLIREQIVLAQDPYPVAPGAERDGDDAEAVVVWSSQSEEPDPRWAQLTKLKLD